MTNQIRAKVLPIAIASLLAAAPALAQNVTSSSLGGTVLDAQGQPVAGATVQIVHVPSGTTKIVTTDVQGHYSAQGLRVGGPFEVIVSKSGMQKAERDDVYLQLGQKGDINLQMTPEAAAANAKNLSAVTVSANALAQYFTPDNKGMSTYISQAQIEATPQANRSIDDIARLDPRINVTNQGDGSISAMGLPNRYNSINVDGLSVGDPFGLNANGLPYQNSPISMDTIAGYNVSTANYDVTSDTVGADINAVTKSGTNQFHGSVYYVFQNASSMVGKAGWLSSSDPGYSYKGFKKNWTGGFTLGGPIVKDKLFFFVAAEKQDVTDIGADSVNGLDSSLGNGPSTSNKLSPGDLQRVLNIANGYGIQTGGFGGSSGVTLEDKRYLAKLDWNISDNHRATLTYSQTTENHPVLLGNSSTSVGVADYRYVQAIKNSNLSLELYDDWNDNFSTETKIGYQHFSQLTNVPTQAPQIAVSVAGYGSPTVYLGEEQYRDYNRIDTKNLNVFFAGTYYAGDHTIKGGVYAESTKIYNLFGRTEFGAYAFNTINDFATGNYYSYNLFQPAPGYTINDVAAKWTYTQYSPFIQDTWQVNNNLSLQYGLRVDIPDSNRAPFYNAAFQQAFGYPNNTALTPSHKVVEPRLSFNYSFNTKRMMQLRGGVGLFQTSPPTVWMTNPYQNNGLTVATYRSFDPSTTPFSPSAQGQNVPPGAANIVGDVDTISPNFKLPTYWKMSLGLDRELPWWGMIGTVEAQEVRARDAILYQAVNIGTPTGVLPDGRLEYWTIPGASPHAKGQKPNAGANPSFSTYSTLLTNTNRGKTDALTLALRKPFSDTSDWSFSAAFTYSHATEVNPGNSSQASSGYEYVARLNPNANTAGIADRNIPRSLKLSVDWRHQFFGNYYTTVSAFYNGQDGLPYTWIFTGDVNGDGISYEDPAYIPTINDPKVFFANSKGSAASAQLVQQFQDYVSSNGYLNSHRGQIAGRNATRAPWMNLLNVSVSQEMPGLFKGNKGILRLDVYNFLNLLDNNWGQDKYLTYNTRNLAGYGGVNSNGQYIYELLTDQNGNYQPEQYSTQDAGSNPTRLISRWSAMLTLRYTF